MELKPDILVAKKKANEVIAEQRIETPPIDPFAIAISHDIEVKLLESDHPDNSFSGCLVKQGDSFGIFYRDDIPSEGFQRFTVAHELGHYFLKHQHEFIFANGIHSSNSGFINTQWYEIEADHFAAELLMPRSLFESKINTVEIGLSGIRELSTLFSTSITSTAIRYAETTPDPVAVIVSSEGVIKYCFVSSSLQRIKGVCYGIRKGDVIPISCSTMRVTKSYEKGNQTANEEGSCQITEWFPDCALHHEMNEDVLALGGYGKILTVLHCVTIPEDEDIQ